MLQCHYCLFVGVTHIFYAILFQWNTFSYKNLALCIIILSYFLKLNMNVLFVYSMIYLFQNEPREVEKFSRYTDVRLMSRTMSQARLFNKSFTTTCLNEITSA